MGIDKKRSIIINFLVIVALVIVLAACGGAEEPISEQTEAAATAAPLPTEPAATEAAPAPTEAAEIEPTAVPPTETPSSGISSFQDVEQAVIQIEAQGSFMDPAEGLQLNSAGRGSGFIIDESGLAVTNNHVVTGAAFLQVWVAGQSEALNAQILGVSECSDLAVIDIEGDGFPYLEWYDGDIDVGTEIYVAGFPLGDPQYTLTRGIISKREAAGNTAWSAVDHVIEYDATTNPGNSGGAVVDGDGRVIAVHYAGYDEARQAFGISYDVAKDIVEQLSSGQDMLAIGINGTAVNDGEGLSGIWVASVESGSPADQTGIKSGDIITKMEGLVLATDATMADYCNILRGHNPDDVLGVEVLRFDTEEVLEGQINGRALETAFSFAEVVSETEEGGPSDDGTETAFDFVEISDDSGAIIMEVPTTWVEIDGRAWENEGTIIGGSLIAAPNIDDFLGTFSTPGVNLIASTGLADLTIDELLDFYDYSEECTFDQRTDYEDPLYTGAFDLYNACGDTESVIFVLAAKPEDSAHAVVVEGLAVTDADIDALDHVLATFNVIDVLPGSE